MSNTVIQLKWSEVTSTPASLNVAEPAYSNTSGKLFIGLSDNSVVAVGGKYYTDIVDASTSSNTSSTLVKRDASGGFIATYVKASLHGKANTADTLETGRYFNLNGDATGTAFFDGSANADITVDLSDTGVTSGTYGGQTQIPVFTVDTEGRLTYAANVSVATTLSVAGDSGSGGLDLLSDVLTIEGGDGITTQFDDSNNKVIVVVDNTVIRTSGTQTINGDLDVTGNLVILGNTTTIGVQTLEVDDPIIYLAANNYVSDIVDIGWAGNYFDGSTQRHTGLIRKHGTNDMYMFTGYNEEFEQNQLNIANPSLVYANLHANLTGGEIFGLSKDLQVVDGGTGHSSFTKGTILVGNASGALSELANTGTAGAYGSAAYVPVITTDNYGRVSNVSNTAINIDTSAVVSGVLPFSRGGTNQTTYTTGAILTSNGSSLVALANTGTSGTYGSASDVPVITTDEYGRVSGVSNTSIVIDASKVVSGTLGVARGGTGQNAFTVKGVIVSDTSSTTGALSALTSSTEGHVLQINGSGVPVFAHLSGGSF